MNQPLMLTATQKAGPTLTALVGGLVLLVLLAMLLLLLKTFAPHWLPLA